MHNTVIGDNLAKKIILKCRECGREYPPTNTYACKECFGPLDVIYDYGSVNYHPLKRVASEVGH